MKFLFGVKSICQTPNIPLTISICLVSFAVSFGSLSVIFQLYSASHNIKVNIFKLIIYKTISGIFSTLISYYLITNTPFSIYINKANNVFLNSDWFKNIIQRPEHNYIVFIFFIGIIYLFLISIISLYISRTLKKSG